MSARGPCGESALPRRTRAHTGTHACPHRHAHTDVPRPRPDVRSRVWQPPRGDQVLLSWGPSSDLIKNVSFCPFPKGRPWATSPPADLVALPGAGCPLLCLVSRRPKELSNFGETYGIFTFVSCSAFTHERCTMFCKENNN